MPSSNQGPLKKSPLMISRRNLPGRQLLVHMQTSRFPQRSTHHRPIPETGKQKASPIPSLSLCGARPAGPITHSQHSTKIFSMEERMTMGQREHARSVLASMGKINHEPFDRSASQYFAKAEA